MPWFSVWYSRIQLSFPKWSRTLTKFSELSIFRDPADYWNTYWGQFKDPAFYLCLDGCVVTSWSLTQEVAGWNNYIYKKLSLNTFRKNSNVLDYFFDISETFFVLILSFDMWFWNVLSFTVAIAENNESYLIRMLPTFWLSFFVYFWIALGEKTLSLTTRRASLKKSCRIASFRLSEINYTK